jgi:hypothetical protein
MWVSGLANFNPGRGGLTGNQQLFMTTCSNGVAEPTLSTAAEMQPELMPGQDYVFAIERSTTAYTLEVTGNFARSGQRTLRFTRPFVAENRPIWHYNVTPGEYDGRYNATLTQTGVCNAPSGGQTSGRGVRRIGRVRGIGRVERNPGSTPLCEKGYLQTFEACR